MATYKIFKETALPGTLQANSIYLIAPASKPDYLEMYVTSNDGSTVKRIINSDDVQAMINVYLQGFANVLIVADITERNALNPTANIMVLVRDATGDPTVNAGAATYIYDTTNSLWVKIAEYESLDLSITWDNLQGKPNSLPADIDDAVSKKHTHANKTQLDKIDENAEGYMTYNGVMPHIGWDINNW